MAEPVRDITDIWLLEARLASIGHRIGFMEARLSDLIDQIDNAEIFGTSQTVES